MSAMARVNVRLLLTLLMAAVSIRKVYKDPEAGAGIVYVASGKTEARSAA